ncbi:hypothetical protein SAMN05216370_0054 [Pseudomonas peli]|uniref:Uncharacterized protein n=1 Tax=Pseudomonas peli TaxID=592361 RepID=A0AB37ZEA3_9PSED|nr:hypothetical protein [Pseudomonas peli]SCW89602.1 hypothetical protein SAMN05216370_0054 [Pseudomonas peli]
MTIQVFDVSAHLDDEETISAYLSAALKDPNHDAFLLALDNAYKLVFESGRSPKMVLDCMDKDASEKLENWLKSFYEARANEKDVSRAVIQGFRTGQFAQEGHGALALAAFLYGSNSDANFSMLEVIESVKA